MTSALMLAAVVITACDGGKRSDAENGKTPELESAAVSALTPTGGEVCVTLARGVASVEDAWIEAEYSHRGANHGSGSLTTGGVTTGKALVKFDLSAIPSSATITRGFLRLNQAATGGSGALAAHLITGPWSESTVTYTSLGGAFTAAPFATADFSPGPLPAAYFEMTSTLQAWIDGIPNHGVLIDQGLVGQRILRSSEDATSSLRPTLHFCYLDICSTVTCAPSDACHVAGTCDPFTGLCSDPVAPNGTACNDGKACTINDVCTNGVCAGSTQPEICDGIDNDCDGQIDNGLGQVTCGVGACKVTVNACVNGQPQTCVPGAPQPETCDGIDNDCDGQIDNGLGQTTCGVGACKVTVNSCVNGHAQACVPGAPHPETCDGIDNDCDGQVDNGFGQATCGVGACKVTVNLCNNGQPQTCVPGAPHAEACDGVDNDCDGQIDNGNPGGGFPCDTGNLGACAAGVTACSGGQIVCNAKAQPVAEVCDGLDNDCDGQVDNNPTGAGQPCDTGLAGPCAAGATTCVNGALICKTDVPPASCVAPPVVTILTPTPNFLAATDTIHVSGVVDQGSTVTVNGIDADIVNLSFSATVPLREGNNLITAAATSLATGNSGAATVVVVRDTSPPRVVIVTPSGGDVLNSGTVTVTGTVQDQVVGTVNAGIVSVTVNGVLATVANRGFEAQGVPVAEGNGTITAIATDSAGNSGSAVITVLRDPSPKGQILVVSGDGQSATVGANLPQPLKAKVVDNSGNPVSGAPITFTITQGNGTFPGGARTSTVLSDAAGTASVALTAGTYAAAASDIVKATSDGFVGAALFSATATADQTSQRILVTTAGANQIVVPGGVAPVPLSVLLTDALGNPIVGQNVTFNVQTGSGQVNGAATAILPTDASGRAFVVLTAGPVTGINSQLVLASAGNAQVTFVATTKDPDPSGLTVVSGVTLTNENAPIANVKVSILGTTLMTLTDSEGRWKLTGAPSGRVHLDVDGTTAGPFPPLSFELELAAGVDNPMDRPVYLPLVDQYGIGMANTTTDLVLQRPDVPGLIFTVPAGSATFTGGDKTGVVQVMRVNRDKIPMVPPDGTLPSVAFAIMPAAVHFDPPAPIRFPNVEGRRPGEHVTIYSYDHDLAEFVGVGSAQVSEDGQFVVSGPGQGIVKGGWHLIPPAPQVSSTCLTVAGSGNKCRTEVCPDSVNCYRCYQPAGSGNPIKFGVVGCAIGPYANTLDTPTPDVECYDYPPYNSAGGNCGDVGTIGTPCNNPAPVSPVAVPRACTRRNDPGYGHSPLLEGQAGLCVVPPFPTAANTLPVCCAGNAGAPLTNGQAGPGVCTFSDGINPDVHVCCEPSFTCNNTTNPPTCN